MTLLFAMLFVLTAAAEDVRFGIFVGNDEGQASDLPLVFATSDARKMRDLFVDLGKLPANNTLLLQNDSRRAVEGAFNNLHRRIVEARNAGQHTTLLFYYSGHGTEESLHLGASALTHAALRELLETSGADVRIAMLDACQSGAAVRAKGGVRGPSFAFQVAAQESRGTAFLTSSAASELSQESAEVGGGFFTHFLHTALMGAADADRDGEVTLPEAYEYVYGETIFGTRGAERTQTPRFDFDLVGAGTIALTTLETASSHLRFLGDLDGAYAVWDESRHRYLAQVEGSRVHKLAVRPGTYFIHKRMPGWVDEARYEVRRGEVRSIAIEDFASVPYERTAARGDLDRMVRRSRLPALSFRVLFGTRRFADVDIDTGLVPSHGVLGVEARFHRPSSIFWWSLDGLAGGGNTKIQVPGREEAIPMLVQSWAAGGSSGIATRPRLFRAGIGGRVELVGFARDFSTELGVPTQRSLTLAPGFQGWFGLHHGRFTGELRNDVLLAALPITADNRHPLMLSFLGSLGYRF